MRNVFPHSRCWNGLGHFLRSISNLMSLRFGFAPFDDGAIQNGTWTSAEGESCSNGMFHFVECLEIIRGRA
jgi:hypothetical protein